MDFAQYSRTFLHFYTTELPDLLKKSMNKEKFSLVDMGAGDGVMLVALEHHGYLKQANEVFAVDLSPERCERLSQLPDLNVICSDVTHVPELDSHAFDYVICTQVIEHVDQEKLMSEIQRILKPGGVLYIASVVKKWYGWWYYKTQDGRWAVDPTHLREYASQHEYESVIERGGFKVHETTLTPLKLSFVEFLMRRIFFKMCDMQAINAFFLKNKVADYLRRKINVRVPGYFIIETLALKNE